MTTPTPKVWGYTTCLFDRGGVEVHRIVGKRGGWCSKHRHQWKYNQFYVERGCLRVTIYGNGHHITVEHVLNEGDTLTVAPGRFHRFRVEEENTVAIEIYYLDGCPTDIEREDVGGITEWPDYGPDKP